MLHFKHRLCNAELPPAEGDEDSVDTLNVQRGKIKGTDVIVTRSYWKFTLEELAQINNDGCVCLTVFGSTHAPLRLDAMPL